MPEEIQADVAYCMSLMGNVFPEVLRELEESLAEDLESLRGQALSV